ncbi:MAG: hypothetical protein FWD83_05295, partial [Promicromonosporaceae bacterium]|nr:hypothetical protein [Promicromonosporaceae bacterium]
MSRRFFSCAIGAAAAVALLFAAGCSSESGDAEPPVVTETPTTAPPEPTPDDLVSAPACGPDDEAGLDCDDDPATGSPANPDELDEPEAQPSPDPTTTPELTPPAETDNGAADSTPQPAVGNTACVSRPNGQTLPTESNDICVQPMTGGFDRTLTNVRWGIHDGLDRIVIAFDEGDAAGLGWWAEFVTEARGDGSGLPIAVDGEYILSLRLAGFRMPEEGDELTSGSGGGNWDGRPLNVGGSALNQIVYVGWFEGNL